LVGSWTKTVDKDKVNAVLRGDDPFDELTMVDDDHGAARPATSHPSPRGQEQDQPALTGGAKVPAPA
jgi:hypothetical protein